MDERSIIPPPPPPKITSVNTHDCTRLFLSCDRLLKNYRHLLDNYCDLLTRCQTILLINKNIIDYYRFRFEHPHRAHEAAVLYRFDDQSEIRIGKLT